MVYIKITLSDNTDSPSRKSFIVRFLSLFLPKANPDYGDYINAVRYWLLEFNYEDLPPYREIGLNEHGKVIMKMPLKDNYGYWTDNNLTLPDFFEHFSPEEIKHSFFEEKWESFR